MASFSRDIRAVPIWLLRDYLTKLGGAVQPGGEVVGPGWQATLTQLEDYRIGSLRVGEVRLAIEGDATALADLLPRLEPKLLRAGG